MGRRDHHRAWDWRFDGILEARKAGYFCVYNGFDHPARWFGDTIFLDNGRILFFHFVHWSTDYSSVGDIRPSLVGQATGEGDSLRRMVEWMMGGNKKRAEKAFNKNVGSNLINHTTLIKLSLSEGGGGWRKTFKVIPIKILSPLRKITPVSLSDL